MTQRYQTSGAEGESEPGSDGLVLRNLVGIRSHEDMDELELQLLRDLYEDVLLHHLPDRVLTVADLKAWHRLWQGNVYPWAGELRTVNLSKDGFPFAAARLLPGLLQTFEREVLARWTPCGRLADGEVVHAIAVTACGADPHSSLPRGQWTPGMPAGGRDGGAVRARATGLQHLGAAQDCVHRRHPRGDGRQLRCDGPVGGGGHGGREGPRSQRASLMWAKRTEGFCSFFSSWATGRPVSTAVELATARSTALRLGVLRSGEEFLGIMLGQKSVRFQFSVACPAGSRSRHLCSGHARTMRDRC